MLPAGTSVQMIQEHYGKWIPDRGLDLAILKALNRDLDRDPGLKYLPQRFLQIVIRCEEGDLNPHGCYPTSPSN